jgi:hypothetical protein
MGHPIDPIVIKKWCDGKMSKKMRKNIERDNI